MMNPAVIAIPFGFVMLAGLLCWHLITAKGRWGTKLALIVLVPSFAFVVWASMSSYLGWPTDEAVAGKAVLLGSVVREPSPKQNDPGEIYVWIVLLDDEAASKGMLEYAHASGEPRAYRMPYSREKHEMLQQAKARMQRGERVILDFFTRGEEEESDGLPEGMPHERRGRGEQGDEQDFMFYDLPEPDLPPKETGE